MRGPSAGGLLFSARGEKARIALAAGLQVLVVGSGMGLMGTAAWLLSSAALRPSIAVLQVAIVGVRAFGLGRALLRYGERLVSHDLTLRLLARLRVGFFRSLVPLAPAALVSARQGDLLARAIEDVQALEGFFARVLGPSLAALGVAVLIAGLLAPFGGTLALIAVTGLLLGGLLGPGLAARLASAPGRRLVALRAALSAALVDGVRGSAELLSCSAEDAQLARVTILDRAAVRAQGRVASASALGSALATAAADLTVIAVFALAVPALRAGRLDGPSLAVVTLLTLAAFEAVAALPLAWQSLGALGAASTRLVSLMETPPVVREPVAVREPRRPEPRPSEPRPSEAPLVELRRLSFTYPGARRPALREVSLTLGATGRVAIVGASGSGKSTLLQLLLRFWDVPADSLYVEGRDVRSCPSDETRALIAYAAQRAHVFTGTLRDNLLFGGSDETLHAEVLRSLALDALVAQLPEGLDTWVGEAGQKLSGGERQRLALARALLRQAPLLLLDEPTAQLDALTARGVMAGIAAAGRGRATLLVTHSLIGLEDWDEVLVLEAGRVVERGPALELVRRDGPFRRLRDRQRAALTLDVASRPE